MSFVVLRFYLGSYSTDFDESEYLYLLVNFLRHDVGDPTSYPEWALTEEDGAYRSGNMSFLRKCGGNIEITDLYPYEDKEHQSVCKIKIQNFVVILDKWVKIRKKKPPRIIITDKGDGDISLEDVL